MSNDYFNHTSPLARHTLARSTAINTLMTAVQAGFAKLPGEALLAQGRVNYCTDTGSANAYAVALPITITAYVAGLTIDMMAATTNTGASTLNVDSLGVRSIKRIDGTNPEAGDITAGYIYRFVFDGTNFQMQTPSRVHMAGMASNLAANLAFTGNPVFSGNPAFTGSPDFSGVANAAAIALALGLGSASTPTFAGLTVNGNIAVTGTVDGRDVAADGSKLDGIESLADVTNTANVTAAGALMDSELANIAAVKALNQGVATTDSPTFAGATINGPITGNAVTQSPTDTTANRLMKVGDAGWNAQVATRTIDNFGAGAEVGPSGAYRATANINAITNPPPGATFDNSVGIVLGGLGEGRGILHINYDTSSGPLQAWIGGRNNLADAIEWSPLYSEGSSPTFADVTVTGTVDGRDIAADGTKLDGIESGADVTDTANVTAAGALMDSELTDIAAVKALNQGVADTDTPTFNGLISTGNVLIRSGGIVDSLVVGNDGASASRGLLTLHGHATGDGNDGGTIDLYVAEDHNSSWLAYQLKPEDDDLVINAISSVKATVEILRLTNGGDLTIEGDLNVGTNVCFVDVSTGRVGINGNAPETHLDIRGTSSAELQLLATGGDSNVYLKSSNTGKSQIFLGDADTYNMAMLRYDHAANTFTLTSNSTYVFGVSATGELNFGTHSALAAETVTGYITIKDIGGTTRKLAVVS